MLKFSVQRFEARFEASVRLLHDLGRVCELLEGLSEGLHFGFMGILIRFAGAFGRRRFLLYFSGHVTILNCNL